MAITPYRLMKLAARLWVRIGEATHIGRMLVKATIGCFGPRLVGGARRAESRTSKPQVSV